VAEISLPLYEWGQNLVLQIKKKKTWSTIYCL
jgi:hypothetical protein